MELLVYKASAGSGKTFTLAVEYIKRLVANPRAYQQTLAVTFTNKATAEMKERILQQLKGIWQSAPASQPYLDNIRKGLEEMGIGLAEAEIRQRCGTALLNMLHDYSRFRVETIDSFFQSVMRNMARELELSPNLNIELDNALVLSDAVDSMIEKLTPASPVLSWLLDYINERIADDKRWNVANELKLFGKNIFDEGYMERGGRLRLKLEHPEAVRLYRDVLREKAEAANKQIKQYATQFEELLKNNALAPEDLKNGSRGIGSYFCKLKNGKTSDKEILNETLRTCLEEPENWASKNSSRRTAIIQLAQNALIPLLQDAENNRKRLNRIINSCRLSLQHLDKLQLLNHIDQEVRLLNQQHNRFLLSDTNALLHRLMGDGDSSFVFEKLGASIRSVMIDEFQDTSRMQWDNFRLLLLEGLSQGADSLIVGDVKQSIYRWRNGDWRILNDLGKEKLQGYFPVRVKSLKTNRRSETNIIRFNNRFFTAAVDFLNGRHFQELHEECIPLKNAYADVVQQSPQNEARGYVKASFLSPDKTHSYPDLTLNALGEEIQQLLAQGVRPNDIAILVRKNKNIVPIATYLEKELQLPVVSDEAFRLDASLALCMLTDALRCLTKPEESIARTALILNYQEISGNPMNWDNLLNSLPPDNLLPPAFTAHADRLRVMPLYELLEELYACFGMNRIAGQEAYVCFFFDAVSQYLQDNPSDIDSFIRYWDETLCNKTIPGGEPDGLRILSIHKSKGLEFHTVLLPFCDWKLENETTRQLVWCVPPEQPYNQLDLVPVNYSSNMAESVYRQDYLRERMQLWVDNLNLLYVAFTRAGSNLILWSRSEQKNTIAELLSGTLPQIAMAGEGRWDEETATYESGGLMASAPLVAEQQKTATSVHIQGMRHSLAFRQSNRSTDFIAGTDEEESSPNRFIDRGRLLHNLFAAIETETDIDTAIDRLVFEGIIAHPDTEENIRRLTHKALSDPQVKDWYSGSWHIFNECDIIWMENGKLCNRRPDRVMMRNKELVVVDFKFGKPHKSYSAQVKEYMRLLADMGYASYQISGYLWYVDQGSIQKVTAG